MFKDLKIKDKSNLEINLSKAFSIDDLIESDDNKISFLRLPMMGPSAANESSLNLPFNNLLHYLKDHARWTTVKLFFVKYTV